MTLCIRNLTNKKHTSDHKNYGVFYFQCYSFNFITMECGMCVVVSIGIPMVKFQLVALNNSCTHRLKMKEN